MGKTTTYVSLAMLFCFANLVLLSTAALLYGDNLKIEYHLDKTVVLSLIFLVTISCIIVSYCITKIFGKDFFQILSKSLILIFISTFSLNIIGFIKCLFSMASYNDILYKCKFFTIRYLYSKEDLLIYLASYYEKISEEARALTRKEKLKILSDAKTIDGVKEKVDAYVHYEQTNGWPKIQEICNTAINWGLEHPYILVSGVAVASSTLIYPMYKVLVNQYNIYTLANGVSMMSTEIQTQSNRSNELAELVQSLLKVTVKINYDNKLTIGVLADFLDVQCDIIPVINIPDNEKTNLMSHIVSNIKKLATIIDANKAAEIVSTLESNITKTQTSQYFQGQGHILGGEEK